MFNEFTIVGNLTRDPELKDVAGDTSVCEFAVAVNRPGKGDEKEADFFTVTAFGKTAKSVAEHKKKGDLVLVKGHLRHGRWETPEGERRSRVELVAHRVQFLPSGRKANETDQAPGADAA